MDNIFLLTMHINNDILKIYTELDVLLNKKKMKYKWEIVRAKNNLLKYLC